MLTSRGAKLTQDFLNLEYGTAVLGWKDSQRDFHVAGTATSSVVSNLTLSTG